MDRGAWQAIVHGVTNSQKGLKRLSTHALIQYDLILIISITRRLYLRQILSSWAPNHCRWWLQPWNKKMLAPWKKSFDKSRQHIKKQKHYLASKGPSSQSYGFSSSHVWLWELDYKESWAPKSWCFWTVVLEKTLESPVDCKESKPVNPKGNQPWIFIGRTDTETPILWPPDAKNWLIGKDSDAGKDWRQEETGMTEDEMVGWHPWLNGHEFEQALEDGEGQGSLACCSPWGHKESNRI